MGDVITYNMCVTLPSLICAVSEAHESLDKLKEAVSGAAETFQSCEATVNVKENSQYITLSCRAFNLSLFISAFCGRSEAGEGRVGSRIQQKAGGATSVCCFQREV